MAPTASISTPIPSSTSPDALIKTLHNHETYIKITCPSLITYSKTSGEPNIGEACVYSVTDKKPMGQSTFTLTLTNQETGIDTLVNAKPPIGTLTVKGQWRVEGEKLVEEVEIEGNMMVKKMAKGNVEKAHPEFQQQLIAEAGKA